MIKKLLRSIITIQKHGGHQIYIWVVQDIQYRGDVFWNVLVLSFSLGKRSLTVRPDQSTHISDSCPSLLKAEVANRVACYVFVIFQTKRNDGLKKFE